MILPQFNNSVMNELCRVLRLEDDRNVKKGDPIDLSTRGAQLTISSPNGDKWILRVANDGTLSAEAV